MDTRLTTRLLVTLTTTVVTLLVTSAVAQRRPVNGIRAADLRAHAIVGATVVIAPGRTVEDATVLMRDGVIEAVGPRIDIPADAWVWPGDDLTVYAGLIDAAVLTKAEPLQAGPGRHWNAKVHPELRLADQAATDDALRASLRKLGFTAAAIYPEEGIFRGSGVVIALSAAPEHAVTYVERASMAMGLERAGSWSNPATPGSLMGVIAIIRQTLLDAGWHRDSRAVYLANPNGNEPPAPADALVALEDVLAGRQALLFETSDEMNLLRAARIADEFSVETTMLGSGLEFRRLEEVVATGAPLIIPLDFPEAPEVSTISQADGVTLRTMMTWEQAPTNAARLVAAGATVALTTAALDNRREFPKALHEAIRHGLAEDDALAALTTVPAQLLGLDHVMGTIEAGKIANLVVVEGSLFEKKPKVRATWINGRRHEIEPVPVTTLVMSGTLRTGAGDEIAVDLDTTKPSVSFRGDGDEKVKAKKVAVMNDTITMVVDGTVMGARGYVRLGGAITGSTVTGTGVMPDGSRFPFTIEGEPEPAPADTAVASADDGIAGAWVLWVSGRRQLEYEFDLTREEGGELGGSVSVMGHELDLEKASYDPSTGRIELAIASARGDRTFEGVVAGNQVSGTTTSDRGEETFEGRRDAGDDEDFELPPVRLVTPLGAFGLESAPAPQRVLVTGATIWTAGPAGVIENGTMMVEDGRIVAIGRDLEWDGPEPDVHVDASGKHVSPGLIDCHSHTGISGGVNEFPEANTAEVRIGDVINPDDINWYRALAGGLTAANQLHGSANPIGGQNSVVKLKWGGSADDLPVGSAIAGIKFALGENVKRSKERYPNTRMGVETFIRDAFTAARQYDERWDRYRALPGYERSKTMPPRRDLELDALVEIIDGERLVHCHSYRQDEILMLVRVAEEFGFTIGTFQHVLEGYKVAEALAAHGAGGSSFSDWWAYKVEVMDAIPHNGALMTDVGVVVSFNSDSSELARRMNTEAAKAVRYGGLEPSEAIKLVTLNPAKQLRIDDRTGSLEVGKDADFVVWSESPLSTYARCEQTWIEGARYFDLETDAAHRATVRSERQRLIQKLLRRAHGESALAREGTDDDTARPTGEETMSAEARAWIEERLRIGEDPFAMQPGDCGCGGLSQFHREVLFEEHRTDVIPVTHRIRRGLEGNPMHRNSLIAATSAALVAGTAQAQSRQIPAPPQARPIVINAVDVHTVSGPTIAGGHLAFRDGVITHVGAGPGPQIDGADVLDGEGFDVYPGLIASITRLGLEETGAVDVTHDHTEYGSVRPEVRAAVAINPDSDHIPVTRANGILTAMVVPRGGLVSGRASLVRLDGWTWEQMGIDAEAGLVLNWPRVQPVSASWMKKSVAEQREEIREELASIDRLFDEAAAYVAARETDEAAPTDLRYEAMRSALDGTKPIFVRAASATQIESAVAWAQRRGFRIVIMGGTEADRVMPLLRAHDVPVIVPGLHRMPSSRHDDYDQAFKLPLRLHQGGVRFSIAASSGGSAHERNLNHNAATAAAYGLPRDQALRAVTLSAAEILGVGDTLGSIEVGKAATFIVTDGDPLEITTETLVAFIDGRRVDLGNRQKSLYAKYREKYRQIGLIE